MRNLHTQNCFSQDALHTPGSVQREMDPPASHLGESKNSDSSAVNNCVSHSFSNTSKLTTMIRNLNSGLAYTRKQDANLNEMESFLRAWRGSLSPRNGIHDTDLNAVGLLYLPGILKLSEEKLFGHPLFGNGIESPIRVHLKLIEGRFVEEIPVLPLLIQPGFSAIAHSGRALSPPSKEVFDLCETEFLNGLLEINKAHRSLERQLSAIQEHQGKLKTNHIPISAGNTSRSLEQRSAFHRIINWFSKSIGSRTTVSAVPS